MEDCRNCTGGEYCNTTAMSSTSGPCQPGYYCPEGSSNSEQMLCPEGSYCELGTFHPESCRTGTFSNNTMLKSLSDCTLCSPVLEVAQTKLPTNVLLVLIVPKVVDHTNIALLERTLTILVHQPVMCVPRDTSAFQKKLVQV